MCDDNGILLGVNKHNNSLIIVDIFNSRVYKIGLYQRLVQKLPFLMCHVRDQQGKEDVEPLYLQLPDHRGYF